MARSVPHKCEKTVEREVQELAFLDASLASVLDAIEEESMPDRLLELAVELQSELALKRQRSQPN